MMAPYHELVSRRAALIERCAAERARLSGYTAPLRSVAERIDHGIARARRLASQPVVILGVLASVALLVRSRQLRWAGKTVGLVATAWRARSMVTSLVSRVRKNSPAVQRVRTAGYSVEAGDGR